MQKRFLYKYAVERKGGFFMQQIKNFIQKKFISKS